jgi:hypothetical protein
MNDIFAKNGNVLGFISNNCTPLGPSHIAWVDNPNILKAFVRNLLNSLNSTEPKIAAPDIPKHFESQNTSKNRSSKLAFEQILHLLNQKHPMHVAKSTTK